MRRATVNGGVLLSCFGNFYPRSPCGERPRSAKTVKAVQYFYPRSPCGERLVTMDGKTHDIDFYPRSPCGERPLASSACRRRHYFYPRSPCGERHPMTGDPRFQFLISIHALLAESDVDRLVQFAGVPIFLSTLSLRRATFLLIRRFKTVTDFYPRSPCGERRYPGAAEIAKSKFLSTLSLRRATLNGFAIL